MTEETKGIKETQELLVALIQVGALCIDRFKDGVDFGDAIAIGTKFASDSQFRGVITEAIKGVDLVGDELADLKPEEVAILVTGLMPSVMDILGKLKA